MERVIHEDVNKPFNCPSCNEELKFFWPPSRFLWVMAANVTCKECGARFEVGGENAQTYNDYSLYA